MMRLSVLAGLACSAVLGACSTTAPGHYYSLMPQAGQPADASAGAPKTTGKFVISVGPVSVPEQVDRPQIVLTEPDSTQVTPLSGYLWAAALPQEVQAALEDDLARRLGVLAVPAADAAPDVGAWTISLQVQRFVSVYGQHALIRAGWRIVPQRMAGRRALYCEGTALVPVQDSVSSLVAGHRQALSLLGGLIAGQITRDPATAPARGGPAADGSQVFVKGCIPVG